MCAGRCRATWPPSAPDGVITVHGRGSASINSGGEKIFPEEVEAAVKSHPDVYDAIVVGLPDERFGERVAAVVRTRDGSGALDLEAVQEHCRGHIAGYKVPRQLLLVDEIPLTAAGKPDSQGGQGAVLTRACPVPPVSRGPAWPAAVAPCPRAMRPTTSTTRSATAPRSASSTSSERRAPASGHSPTTRAGTGSSGHARAATRAR